MFWRDWTHLNSDKRKDTKTYFPSRNTPLFSNSLSLACNLYGIYSISRCCWSLHRSWGTNSPCCYSKDQTESGRRGFPASYTPTLLLPLYITHQYKHYLNIHTHIYLCIYLYIVNVEAGQPLPVYTFTHSLEPLAQ